MSKLHIFGDSQSEPGSGVIDPRDSWWGLVANELKGKICGVENWSWGGNNIDSICHIIISNFDQFSSDDYLIIGIPQLQRLTMYNPSKEMWPKKVIFNSDLQEQDRKDILCHRGLAQYSIQDMGKQFVLLWNPSWREAQVLRMLLTLNAFLKQNVSNVLFVNLSIPFQSFTEWPVLTSLQKIAADLPNMILFEDTYYSVNYEKNVPVDFDQWKWMGHHGPAGNRHWYETILLPKMKSLGWL